MAEKKKKIRFKAGAELSGKVNAVSATVYSETPEDTPKEVDTVKIRFAIMKADAPETIK